MSDSNVAPISRSCEVDSLSIRMERVRHVLDLYLRSIEPQVVPALELILAELGELETEIERLQEPRVTPQANAAA